MSQPTFEEELGKLPPEIVAEVRARAAKLVTEDDTPVDNIYSEKQMRLLVEPLYTSWANQLDETGQPRKFLAVANVGLFYAINQPPVVPDVMLSLDVEAGEQWEKIQKSYFLWEFGKAPEVVIEVVSNREGNEDTTKLERYALIGVAYYVIYDPLGYLGTEPLKIHKLSGKHYVQREHSFLEEIGLGLTLWEGEYGGWRSTWLRWCDQQETLLPTGVEQAVRANQEATRADHETAKAARLAAKLRELGIDPDQI